MAANFSSGKRAQEVLIALAVVRDQACRPLCACRATGGRPPAPPVHMPLKCTLGPPQFAAADKARFALWDLNEFTLQF